MTGFLKTVLCTIKNAVGSRDTFLIFAIASLSFPSSIHILAHWIR